MYLDTLEAAAQDLQPFQTFMTGGWTQLWANT
jgi:hypothetical protein